MATPLDSHGQPDIELLRERLHALRHAIDATDQLLDRSVPAEQVTREREEHHLLLDQIDELLSRYIAAEHALREREERYRLLVEGVRDYAIFMLDATGHIISWNAGAERIKGYTADEIIGCHFSIFYPAEDIQRHKPATELKIATQQGQYQEEGWRVRKDGSLFWANVLITALYDTNGQVRGFGKVTRDMTEQRRAAAEREQLREREAQLKLEQESRKQMEALVRMRDEFLTVASHELRTPLTALLGNAQLLKRHAQRATVFSERDRRSVDVIADQASRLNRMVLTLLDLSRLQMGQMTLQRAPLDLGALARRVVEEVRPTNTKHTIEYIGPDAPLMIDGDALRLEQVLQNLVQNAIKYSPAGGPVRVQVGGHADMVSVAVTDEGIGIPAASLSQLFQRFYRAANVDGRYISGLGIGLYVVKEIVSRHGGRIEVASVEGQGSTFTVWLPVLGHTLGPRDSDA